MKELSNCPVCSGGDFLSLLICNDYSTTKEDFTIVSCNSCDFTFTNPRPTDENLGKYYLSDKYIWEIPLMTMMMRSQRACSWMMSKMVYQFGSFGSHW